MSIADSVVSSNVTRDTLFPSRAGFATVLFCALHTLWVDRVRKFTSWPALKSAITAGGGGIGHPVYVAGQAFFGQNPHPKTLVIGKRTLAYTQVVKFTPINLTVGYVYTFEVITADGVIHEISYTVQTGDDATDIATAIAALVDALTGVAAVAGVGLFNATSDAGVLIRYRKLPPIADLLVQDTSTDPGIATDLDAIEAATKRTKGLISWYAFTLDHGSEAANTAAAAWAEAGVYLFVPRTSDGQCADAGVTNDGLSDLKAAGYKRTGPIFAQWDTADFRDLALCAKVLPQNPGAVTWAFKQLSGITYDNLEDEESSNIRAKLCTTYELGGGIPITFEGATSGAEYLDLVVATDLINARVSEDVYAFLAKNPIVLYNQAGIDAVLSVVQNRLNKFTGTPNPILSTDLDADGNTLAPTVDPILVSDVDTSDKATRTLTGITWRGTFNGAIHKVEISGTIGL